MMDTKDLSVDTLFYAFSKNLVLRPDTAQRIIFLNARFHEDLDEFKEHTILLQQFFKPYVTELQNKGFSVQPDFRQGSHDFDAAFVLLPKNQVEAEYVLARGLSVLKPGGLLVVSADNKAGGGRLEKTLYKFGLSNLSTAVKHKARVAWTSVENFDAKAVQSALVKGEEKQVLNGQFFSQPGIFGWDKIDLGSKILLQHLPENLKDAGADFGCGYGYLSCGLVQQKSITSLACIDADWRAVAMTQKNLAAAKPDFSFECTWEDLSISNPARSHLDFIVMNPPFHEGKLTNNALGVKFIETAARSLKAGGQLWMVANAHLPYEDALVKHFKTCSKVFEGEGFKVLHAVK